MNDTNTRPNQSAHVKLVFSEVKLLTHHLNEVPDYDGDEDSDAGEGDFLSNHFDHEEIIRKNSVIFH